MSKYNDINLNDWKESDVWTDSLWIINERNKSGKHSNFYHGNFVPQIPRQLIKRYTKKNDVVFDPFLGSGTTAYEAEILERNFIGIELKDDLVEQVRSNLDISNNFSTLIQGDSTNRTYFDMVRNTLKQNNRSKIQLAILHPPYSDIIQFSTKPEDLCNASSVIDFLHRFKLVLQNTIEILETGRFLAIVMGDKYSKGEWIPLGFYCMNEAQKVGLTLKSVVVKNMVGNRAKINQEGIWRYRALSSDYYLFKHEYIFIFKY